MEFLYFLFAIIFFLDKAKASPFHGRKSPPPPVLADPKLVTELQRVLPYAYEISCSDLDGKYVIVANKETDIKRYALPQHFLLLPSGISMNTETSEIFVAFRPTLTLTNWLTNTNVIRKKTKVGYVHEGFLTAYFSIRDNLLAKLDTTLAAYPSYKVVFTGHSLGGALSTIAAADALGMISNPQYLNASAISLISYGSPRVLDPELAKELSSSGIRHYRVTNRNDIVPHIPPKGTFPQKFAHVSNLVWLNERNETMTCDDSPTKEDTNCSNSYKFMNLAKKAHIVNWWGSNFGFSKCTKKIDDDDVTILEKLSGRLLKAIKSS